MTLRRIALVLAALLAACGAHPDLTKEDVTGAVEAALIAERPCIGGKDWLFPLRVPAAEPSTVEEVRALDELAAAGLLRSSETTMTASRFTLGPDGGSRDQTVPAKEYVLTDSGRTIYRSYDAPGYGTVGAFCYGRWEVDVLAFSNPSESSSGNLTTVTFTRRVAGVPDWAQSPALAPRSSALARGRAGTQASTQERMSLVRSDSGWVRTGF